MDFYGFFLVSFTNYSIEKSNSDFTTRTYKKVSNGNIQFLLKCRSSYRLRLIGNSFFLFWEILHFNFLNKSMGTSIK
ncbi:hypothetical protein LEP1GSC175_0763 [Leptospira santarosai str. HAI821]|uniref:Uncharacterized protein n=3 Tax=Leptospira santarosai TaxID=28183 RepID=M6ULS9_9LEPT|nr:hypothetical protein LEP1GSC179_1938 [Leptospira santarosai str. MOR084]EKS07585.1 hypothetical protein LEP1GSC071_0933 [Leptospira santarosai str. JET]EKT88665.1 hypothetical protein LSS_01129 [Leptospira santarosai serovar Shermani str. LT 821]EMO14712.1 hypothetical protein LEP1GSC165_2587 [Leptospira santarosai str. CBC523]EMO30830.1 hypothetical protein LEP1GSC175_0763 [Leptospira santarosai str. HAI821]EMO43771.1 hypothetical protein LEP1GSC187_2467 [Leptospira santarosai str. ZUN179]